jgi:hypothetical protein
MAVVGIALIFAATGAVYYVRNRPTDGRKARKPRGEVETVEREVEEIVEERRAPAKTQRESERRPPPEPTPRARRRRTTPRPSTILEPWEPDSEAEKE